MGTVSEDECETRRELMHARINERVTWKFIKWVLGVFVAVLLSSYGYTYNTTDKIEMKQWDAAEKMVTKDDFKDFKQDLRYDLSEIKSSIEKIGK